MGVGVGVAVGVTAVNVAMARPYSNSVADFDLAWSRANAAAGAAGTTVVVGEVGLP